jgi:redox-sensitive bicupin YhaK (pirin superfamily)
VRPRFQGFAYVLEAEAAFGSTELRAKQTQLLLLCSGEGFTLSDTAPGTRNMLMTGQPYGEEPMFNGPFVDQDLSAYGGG